MSFDPTHDPNDPTPENTGLSPREYERRKTAEGRVEDYAYTINHALVCSSVDILGTPVADWTEKKWGFRFELPGHSHDHSHSHGDAGHAHVPMGKDFGAWWRQGGRNWFIGEVIGDYAAVPVTVAFQRWTPGFMNNLRSVMEPVLGPLFRHGARSAARRWGAAHGFAEDSPEVAERFHQVYEHEVRHLPQALMWTVSSTAINIATQYGLERNHIHGHLGEWLVGKGLGKLASSAVTAGVVVGVRGLTPQRAESWDRFTSKHIFLPLTEKVGGPLGVRKEDVERMEARKERLEHDVWAERIKRQPEAQAPTVDASPRLV